MTRSVLSSLALLSPLSASAADIFVPTDYATLGEAVAAAAATGDTVYAAPADYSGESTIVIDGKDLRIISQGDSSDTKLPALSITDSTVRVTGFELMCGPTSAIDTPDSGTRSLVYLRDVAIANCTTDDPIIRVQGTDSRLDVLESRFENVSTLWVGAITASPEVRLTDTTFVDMEARADSSQTLCPEGCGGAVTALGDLAIYGTTFTNGQAGSGGAIYLLGGAVTPIAGGSLIIVDSTFDGSVSDTGASHIQAEDLKTVRIESSTFVNGTAGDLGAVYLEHRAAGAPLDIDVLTSAFEANTSTAGSGGLFVESTGTTSALDITGSWFCGNGGSTGAHLETSGIDGGAVTGTVLALGGGAPATRFHDTAASLTNTSIAGAEGAVELAFSSSSTSLTALNTLFLDVGSHVVLEATAGVTGSGSYNALYDSSSTAWADGVLGNAFSSSAVTADPLVRAYVSGTSTCADLDLWLGAGSPLRDAGDPSITDLDGTRSDIGAYGGPASTLPDADADGSYADLDCDDSVDTVYPGATETPYDGIDQDCDGADLTDVDGDGYDALAASGDDCDDDPSDDGTSTFPAAQVNPGATETWYDGVDQDCDGGSDYDQDGDGATVLGAPQGSADDCDDDPTDDGTSTFAAADVGPNATETWYDGFDQDCDGQSDYDQDGDGFDSDAHGGIDCDDTAAAVNPTATETWYDGVDSDCDGESDYDQDGDGYDSDAHGGEDCDDDNDIVNPDGSDPTVDGIDQDCDGTDGPGGGEDTDEDSGTTDDDGRTCGCASARTGGAVWLLMGLVPLVRRRR